MNPSENVSHVTTIKPTEDVLPKAEVVLPVEEPTTAEVIQRNIPTNQTKTPDNVEIIANDNITNGNIIHNDNDNSTESSILLNANLLPVNNSIKSILNTRDIDYSDIIDEEITGTSFVSKTPSVEYIIKPEIYDTKPLFKVIGQYGMSQPYDSKTGYEASSSSLMSCEVAYRAPIDKISDTVTSESYYTQGNPTQSLSLIHNRVFSAIVSFLSHLTFFTYDTVQGVTTQLNDVISNVVGNRRTITTESKPNPHPLIGSATMVSGPKEDVITLFHEAEELHPDAKARLGVFSTDTSNGARNVRCKSLEIIDSIYAFNNAIMSEIINVRGTINRYILPLVRSIMPKGSSVSVNFVNEVTGPNYHIEPLIDESGLAMQSMLLLGSPEHQNMARTVVREIGKIGQMQINADLITKTRTAFRSAGQIGASLSTMVRSIDPRVLTDVCYAEMAPYLFDVTMDFNYEKHLGAEMIPVLMPMLMSYIIHPRLMEMNAHLNIPYIMRCMENFTFGTEYITRHRYCNNSGKPISISQDAFRSNEYYPNILKPAGGNELSQPMLALRNLIRYEGVEMDNVRTWDTISDKPILGPFAHAGLQEHGLHTLQDRIATFETLWKAIIDDRSTRKWERSVQTALDNLTTGIVTSMYQNIPDLHYSYAYVMKAIASSPAVCVPLQQMHSQDIDRTHSCHIMRNGTSTYGHRMKLNISSAHAFNVALCYRSTYVGVDGAGVDAIHISNDEAKRLADMMGGLLVEGQKAAIAYAASQAAVQYISNSVESIAPFDHDTNSRDWVTDMMKNICIDPENATFPRHSVMTNDFIMNPIFQGMLVASRPYPSVVVSKIQQILSTHFPSQLTDFVTCTDGSHTGSYLKDGEFYYTYGSNHDQGNQYVSPVVKLISSELLTMMAAWISKYLEPTDLNSQRVSGIVIAGTREETVSRFISTEQFDWNEFIQNGNYEKDGTDITHKKVWLVGSMVEDLQHVPEDYDYVGLISIGGSQNMRIVPTFQHSTQYTLYICKRENYNQDPNSWNVWDYSDRIILRASSSALFTKIPVAWEVIRDLITATESTSSYPGSFVFYDEDTIFTVDPSDFIGISNTLLINNEFDFYKDSAYINKVPPMFDDIYNMRDSVKVGSHKQKQYVRFIDTKTFTDSVLTIRPNAVNSVMNGQNYYDVHQRHMHVLPLPFMAQFQDDFPVEPLESAITEYATGDPRYVHLVTMINSKTIYNFDSSQFIVLNGIMNG